MDSIENLQPLIVDPIEDLDREYKQWLDLREEEHRATLAKAAIAMVNHGGGFIVIGFAEQGQNLLSKRRPTDIPEITQDHVNNAIRRYAEPKFHCRVYNVEHPNTSVSHTVISAPSTLTVPVRSKRKADSIAKDCYYIRKPGPISEGPCTSEEWRALLKRCVLANRDELLESIRSIVSGRIEAKHLIPNALTELQNYCATANNRWKELVSDQPDDSPLRFPHGYYEIGFSLVDVTPVSGLNELQDKIRAARRTRFTGWPPFLELPTDPSYPYRSFIEMRVKSSGSGDWRTQRPSHYNFWRASLDGKLYAIRGYIEDDQENAVGKTIDISIPVWRVGEVLLFANRFAETFNAVEQIAIQCRFTGLNGRRLVSKPKYSLFNSYVSHTDAIILKEQVTLQQAQDNLAEILHKLLSPLYEKFNFFKLPFSLVQGELQEMMKATL